MIDALFVIIANKTTISKTAILIVNIKIDKSQTPIKYNQPEPYAIATSTTKHVYILKHLIVRNNKADLSCKTIKIVVYLTRISEDALRVLSIVLNHCNYILEPKN